jgi:sterol desaturase/sphingolipid hydroxylase (fatty acid hydroxylase superfamily)
MGFTDEKKKFEYEKLFAYDMELTKLRWAVFIALFLFSVSLIIVGFVLQGNTSSLASWAKYAIAFGFLVYLTATYHYFWHHRISHRIRDRLVEIEKSEGIDIITTVRKRPGGGFLKPYFHWAIWIMGAAYLYLTFLIVGKVFFLYYIGSLILSILILAVVYNIILPAFQKEKRKNKE